MPDVEDHALLVAIGMARDLHESGVLDDAAMAKIKAMGIPHAATTTTGTTRKGGRRVSRGPTPH